MNHHSKGIVHFFEETFNEKKCHDLCRQYKFIERSTSKIQGYEFIKTMIMPSDGLSTESLKGLCKRMKEYNLSLNISAQALCERINNISSSRLMKGILAEILKKTNERLTRSCPKITATLNGFQRILLQDSTVAQLNEKLEGDYKGSKRGNNGVKSQVKIDLIHDLSKGLLIDAKLFRGNQPDQSQSKRILEYIQPGDLVIRDLGYFVLPILQTIAVVNAYFLSRLKPNVNVYLNKDDIKPLDIGRYLRRKKNLRKNILEFNGYISEGKIPARLIIYRQTEEVTNRRLRVANKNARNKGETMSKSKKQFLSFAIFVTNAPQELLPVNIVGTIYRLRWEIELVFKRWKAQLEIDYLKGIDKERIDCLIWSRLCTVVIIELIVGYFKGITDKSFTVELSEVKLIQYLLRNNGFCTALARDKLEGFFIEMEKDLPRFILKDKRHRKTMRERVFCGENYYGIQMFENQQVA